MNQFCGHPTAVLDNGFLHLEYLTDVGPRIARLCLGKSGINLLAEVPAEVDTPYGRFQFMGGHRFWHSPEALPRTYIPDQRVTIETAFGTNRRSGDCSRRMGRSPVAGSDLPT